MAENQSAKKGRLNEIIVVGFVIITMALLIYQLSLDSLDTNDQLRTSQTEAQPTAVTVTPPANATPLDPTPTFDIGSVPITDME